MSKMKMSFSLILAIFLVGILSTAAFAKDPYGFKPVSQADLTLYVPFTGNSADATDIAGRSFDVDLIAPDGTTVVNTYAGVLDSSKKGGVTIPAADITPGLVYTVKLYHTDDAGHATLLSKSSAVVEDPHNGAMLNTDTAGTKLGADGQPLSLDVNGNGLQNANLTGYNNTRKNRSGQKVHGFYQNNTNSCASCHQTHTAANGESLLFKDGVYSTCSACHDGTTGAYNSFGAVSSDMTASISGTFNVQTAGHNGSLHEADGSLEISAAPGGNKAGGAFAQEFDCASCHAAHGSGSLGENNLNTDPMGWGAVPYSGTVGQSITYVKGHSNATITTTIDNKNGKLFTYKATDIINDVANIPTTETFPYILVKTQAPALAADVAKNVFWSRAGVQPNDLVIQMYRWDNTKYVADYSLWNRELGYPYVANTVFLDASKKDLTSPIDSALKVIWRDGFAFGPKVANIDTAVVSVGIDVETTGQIQSLYDSAYKGVPVMLADGVTQATDALGAPLYKANTAYVSDSGTEMSKYCASCHTDYASTTRTDNTGVYTVAHRHAVMQDKLTCVRCHYGHGSEAQIMHDANDNTYFDLTASGKVFDATTTDPTAKQAQIDKAVSYFVDPNPSSALKRYTGMAVCYACHGKGEQFIGANSGTQPDKTTSEYLKGGDPGSTRTIISQ